MGLLELEMRGTTALLTLRRPPANALNHEVFRELSALLPKLCVPAVRAVVLTGEGRFFSAGLDLFQVFSYSPLEATAFTTAFDDGITGLFALSIPVVAAVNGHAVAGGAVLAATADHRLMAEGSGKTGVTELLVGVAFPTSAMEAIRYSCAGPHLRELLYRGQTYLPADALSRRLVDEVVPAAELLPRALSLAEELGRIPQMAFATTKRALRAEALATMAAARANGEDPIWSVWRTPETVAAMEAYRQRLGSKRG